MTDEGDFVPVRGKRRCKRKPQKLSSPDSAITFSNCEIDLQELKDKIERNSNDIISSDFYQGFQEQLGQCLAIPSLASGSSTNRDPSKAGTQSPTSVTEIVCYGIGNFSTCLIARNQLALLLAMREECQVPLYKTSLYDPKFLSAEKELLLELGVNVLDKNEECKRKCHKPTLFYMPHCGKSLYNNLLWSNWSLGLSNLIIIGNSFSNMVDKNPRKQMKKAEYILSIQPYTSEVMLPQTYRLKDVFNDTAIHTFPSAKLQSCPDGFWSDKRKPEYDSEDVEFISNKKINC
ncbi:hypothetical protein ScPMuIL_005754 [Solemya velum]